MAEECLNNVSQSIQDEEKRPLLKEEEPERKARWKIYIPCRYILVAHVYLGNFCAIGCRNVFNIALVAMVNLTATDTGNNTSDECHFDDDVANFTSGPKSQTGEFDWDVSTQTTLLGSFYYGYMILQFPGGFAAEKFGVKKVFGLAVLLSCTVPLFIPLVARWNVNALLVARVIQGLAQSPMYPSIFCMVSSWAPEYERSTFIAIIDSAFSLGSVVWETIGGVLCNSNFLGGWPSAFYVTGTVGIIWFITWILFAYESPRHHPRISAEELKLIESEQLPRAKYKNPPWCSLVKSIPLWALLITTLTDSTGFYAVLNCIPLFMKQILLFDIVQSGFLSSGPLLMAVPVAIVSAFIADKLMEKKIFSRTFTRKLFTFLGQGVVAALFLAIGYVDCNRLAAASILFLAITLNAIHVAGFFCCMVDIAPRYAGTIMGIINGISSAGGFLGPLSVGLLVSGTPTSAKWRNVFFLNAGVYGVSALSFCLFGTAEVLPWAKESST